MKVIALIDKPKSCASCPFLDMDYALDMCRLSKKQVTTAESINIPDWCELKPLPEKKMYDLKYGFEAYMHDWGWNDCLNAIVGETE